MWRPLQKRASAGGCARGFLQRQTGSTYVCVGTPCTAAYSQLLYTYSFDTAVLTSSEVAEKENMSRSCTSLVVVFVSAEWPPTRVNSEWRAVGRYRTSSKLPASAWTAVSTKREQAQTQTGSKILVQLYENVLLMLSVVGTELQHFWYEQAIHLAKLKADASPRSSTNS